MKEANERKKGAIVFLRSCDLHGLRRLDDIYLKNGDTDYFYNRFREKVKFVLMGCSHSFDNCFCVDMGTNISENYACSLEPAADGYRLDCKLTEWDEVIQTLSKSVCDVVPSRVTETKTRVRVSETLTGGAVKNPLWQEYDSRCIGCGRCDDVCPEYISFSACINKLSDGEQEVSGHDK